MLKLNRDKAYADSARAYKIFIDGKQVGMIKNGGEEKMEVDPGNHNIYIKIDWCRTDEMVFEFDGKNTIHFKCGNNLKGWKKAFPFFVLFFSPRKYLWLKRADKNSEDELL